MSLSAELYLAVLDEYAVLHHLPPDWLLSRRQPEPVQQEQPGLLGHQAVVQLVYHVVPDIGLVLLPSQSTLGPNRPLSSFSTV